MLGDDCSVSGHERGERLRVKAGEGVRQLLLDIHCDSMNPAWMTDSS